MVDDNSDTYIIRAAPSQALPEQLRRSYESGRWTEYMQRVLTHLHSEGVGPAAMRRVMATIPFTPGMRELLDHLRVGRWARG